MMVFANIGTNSCDSYESCYDAGEDDGYAAIGHGSCFGNDACYDAGYDGGYAVIAAGNSTGSCNGYEACYYAGDAGPEYAIQLATFRVTASRLVTRLAYNYPSISARSRVTTTSPVTRLANFSREYPD